MQSPLLALCVLTMGAFTREPWVHVCVMRIAVGGFLSEDEIQIGLSILSVGIMTASRFPCKRAAQRNTRFHRMDNKEEEEEMDADSSEI